MDLFLARLRDAEPAPPDEWFDVSADRILASAPAGVAPCWLWPGAISPAGYGRWSKSYVHRLIVELLVGPIPPGHQVDHLCRRPRCCNPAHLEVVTAAENTRRARPAVCANGHQQTGKNIYVEPSSGQRRCALCVAARARRRRSGPIPATVPHGRASTYQNWGCRCGSCSEANRLYQREWRAARSAR